MNSRILMLIISTIYTLGGIIFLGWDVFYIVYLFWFENFIRIVSYRFKINSVSHILSNNQVIDARYPNGNLVIELKTPFALRLFFYFLYFIFIVVGFGLVFPLLMPDSDSMLKAFVSFISIVTFKHFDFNIALLLCIVNEVVLYYKEFKINKLGSLERPFSPPSLLEKEDMILHLSIIFTGVFAFVAKHPAFETFQNSFTAASFVFVPAILLVTLKFFAQLYDYKTKKEQEEGGVSLSPEKEDLMDRVKDL